MSLVLHQLDVVYLVQGVEWSRKLVATRWVVPSEQSMYIRLP